MPGTFLLVDFENVQPKNLAQLRGRPVHVMIFVGSQQSKLPFELAQTVQALGERAEYVQIAGTGRNALDLHIAYYVGRLAAQHPGAQFFIFSKDRDYDVLIKHLVARSIRCRRTNNLGDLPAPQGVPAVRPSQAPVKTPAAPDRLAPVVAHLRKLKGSRPRKLKTLKSSLAAQFAREGGAARVEQLIEDLRQRGVIAIEGNDVTYVLD